MTLGNIPLNAETYSNCGLAEIEKWARGNKTQFNEMKSNQCS